MVVHVKDFVAVDKVNGMHYRLDKGEGFLLWQITLIGKYHFP